MNEIKQSETQKVLLALMPNWTPQIPPMGIACLTSFLRHHNYPVTAVDFNTEIQLRQGYDLYFRCLKTKIPPHKQGNFQNIGNEVWQSHLFAYITSPRQTPGELETYNEAIRMVVNNVFYTQLTDNDIKELENIVADNLQVQEQFLVELLEKEKPDVLGLSVFIGTLPASLFAFKLTKERFPHITTVMGGGVFNDQLGFGSPNLDYFLEKTTGYIDKIIIGEGELLMLKLLRNELPPDQRVFTINDIGNQTLDLSASLIPDITEFELKKYFTIGAYASRSCPFQCKFCTCPVLWKKYRKKSPDQVVKELSMLHKQHGYQLFILTDLLMNPLVSKLSKQFMESDLSLYWDGPLRVCNDACDTEKTRQWRKGGYYRAELGCESGSQRILDLMDKRITVEQIRGTLTSLAAAGIKTTTYWVIGFPGETEEDFQATLDLVEELKDSIYEAMNNAFMCFHTVGLVNDTGWMNDVYPLFPDHVRELIWLQQWIPNTEPSREERYRRVNRFVQHIQKLGIPDINSMQDVYRADERWKKLHANAVPAMVEFEGGEAYIKEKPLFQEENLVQSAVSHDGDWGF